MKAILLLPILALVFSAGVKGGSGASQQLNPKFKVAILETGEFHGDEVTAKTGEMWLGLHISDQGSLLLPYRLKVEAVHDPILDDDETQQTGKAVSVDVPVQPAFLLKGASMLSEGPVITVHKGEKTLEKASPLSLILAGKLYELKVVGNEDKEKCGDQLLLIKLNWF